MTNPITTVEAARRKGCTRQAIVDAIGRGEINARKLGNLWIVEDDAKLAAWEVQDTGVRARRVAEAAAPDRT